MKTILNRILSIVLTLALIIILLSYFTGIVENKDSKVRFSEFYTANPDVIFLGSSHTMHGVLPTQLWDDYGMAGYNCAVVADYMPSTYWVMKNLLDYSSPKLMVIDCYALGFDFKFRKYSFLHSWLDSLPLSANKIHAIWDLTNDPVRDKAVLESKATGDNEDKLDTGVKSEFVWDFVKYHSRWSQLEHSDFDIPVPSFCGAIYRNTIAPQDYERPSNVAPREFDDTSTKYLYKMIDECKERNIEVLLTFIPFTAGQTDIAKAEFVQKIASERNVKYINFMESDTVNYETDFFDGSHLNFSGQLKVTKNLGKFIADNYSIPDRREDEKYSYWEQECRDFASVLLEQLSNTSDEEEFMELLQSDNLVSLVAINNDKFFEDKIVCSFLKDMGLDVDEVNSFPCYLSIRDGRCSMKPVEELSEDMKAKLEGDCSIKAIVTSEYSEKVVEKEL